MDFQERRLAQIVRDFMEAYELATDVHRSLEEGSLDFATVESLVGDSEQSALYRLKEETHALFRFDKTSNEEELQAEALFDLAVGALFHEAMKFREGYYLTTAYSPRLESMLEARHVPGPLAASFRKVLEAGRQRMRESAEETQALFHETREQLLIMLRSMPQSRAVARTLVDDPDRTERVFSASLGAVLAQIYGSVTEGYRLAIESMIDSGHFDAALNLLERQPVRECGACANGIERFARGMESYYAGDLDGSLDHLAGWIELGANGPVQWQPAVLRVLRSATESENPRLIERARALLSGLSSAPPPEPVTAP